jgi:hypothetical protein
VTTSGSQKLADIQREISSAEEELSNLSNLDTKAETIGEARRLVEERIEALRLEETLLARAEVLCPFSFLVSLFSSSSSSSFSLLLLPLFLFPYRVLLFLFLLLPPSPNPHPQILNPKTQTLQKSQTPKPQPQTQILKQAEASGAVDLQEQIAIGTEVVPARNPLSFSGVTLNIA